MYFRIKKFFNKMNITQNYYIFKVFTQFFAGNKVFLMFKYDLYQKFGYDYLLYDFLPL